MSSTDFLFIIFISFISFFSHFYLLGTPNGVVFDEVYFGNFTNYYIKGKYLFDIHPPTAKLLMFAGSKLLGYSGNLTFGEIGDDFETDEIWKIRFWPCLAGALRGPFLYLTLKLMDISSSWCFVVSLMVSVDNGLITESRYVLIDAFLSFFALLTMFSCAYISRRRNPWVGSILAGFAVGLCAGTKLTGAGTGAAVAAVLFLNYPFFSAIRYGMVSAWVALVTFFIPFGFHFALLPHPGMGCNYSPRYLCMALKNGEKLNPFKETIPLFLGMLRSNLAIQEGHAYSSKWWQWPIMAGLGTYLYLRGNVQIWCIGNPFVWLPAFFGILVYFFIWPSKSRASRHLWVLAGYFVSYLPFMLIHRVMWNYHYFIPLLFSLICLAIVMDLIQKRAMKLFLQIFLVCGSLCAYYIYMPITYGLPQSPVARQRFMYHAWTY